MRIAVLNEQRGEEKRVALTPDGVKILIKKGWRTHVESGAGFGCGIDDAQYKDAGATVHKNAEAVLDGAKVLFCLGGPTIDRHLAIMPPGLIAIGHFDARQPAPWVDKARRRSLTIMALDLLPRIPRAQSMDILSSQANLAGYRAVIESSLFYTRAIPMMMTAAGTISPARVFIMGVGVAGLQAIATARRMGAQVSATDVRFDTIEQVESLGATFIAVQDKEFEQARDTVYAKQMSDTYRVKQSKLIAGHLPQQDIVITTALIPGRPAPCLLDKSAIDNIRPGSIVADLAASAGGNCVATKPGEVAIHKGITVLGYTNWAARIPYSASQMLGGNYRQFLSHVIPDPGSGESAHDKKPRPSGHPTISLDLKDDILAAVTLCHAGQSLLPSSTKSA